MRDIGLSNHHLKKYFRLVYLTSAVVLAAFSVQAADAMYKWTDAKGIVHYTEKPPANSPFEVIRVKNSSSSNRRRVPVRQPSQPPGSKAPLEAQSDVTRYKAARKHNCKTAQRNLYTLMSVARIRITGTDGKERLLTDDEKKQKIALSKEQVDTYCAPDKLLGKKANSTRTGT